MSEPKRTVTFVLETQTDAIIDVPDDYPEDLNDWSDDHWNALEVEAISEVETYADFDWSVSVTPKSLD